METGARQESVSRTITMQIQLEGGGSAAMPCTLHYGVADPFAVSATFHSNAGDVTWVFGRELLVDGLEGPAGSGDIVIEPIVYGTIRRVRLQLASPSGEAVMLSPRLALEEFVSATEALLPSGQEWMYLNFDAGLEELLGNGGPAAF